MLHVQFYEQSQVADEKLEFSVMVAQMQGNWVFCRHRQRSTYECPGGHREAGETVLQTARRELFEETGALEYELTPVCVYSVAAAAGQEKSFGMLYWCEIMRLGPLPPTEIERIELLDELPDSWTYPEIQPLLLRRALDFMGKSMG